MRIGFLSNQMDNRGTGNAVYNYAHYNEELLGNQSKIFTFPDTKHDERVVDKFINRFGKIYTPSQDNLTDCDALYHIKYGTIDDYAYQLLSYKIPYLVHAVFEGSPAHGDRYAVVSEWMSQRDNQPFVPHIVQHPDVSVDFRKSLNIDTKATVFGRIGGPDTFDIPWVWDAIAEVLATREDYYFIFVATNPGLKHERILYFPPVVNANTKRAFVNSCDAMIHARERGETFGIAVGEFAVLGKPIFTYGLSYEKAHLYELRGTARTYNNKEELVKLLLDYERESAHPFYDKFTPELVMAKFYDVFLDG